MTNCAGGYFSDFSRTQAARSYFTRRRWVRPMRRQRRIVSCLGISKMRETLLSSFSKSSVTRTVCVINSFFSSFIKAVLKLNTLRQIKKSG